MTAQPTWTLRFTEWECGHHQQRPDDIPVSSPEQAKAICWAIACAINQPGSARAMLFNDREGYSNIFMTDDYCEWDPRTERVSPRPFVVLCDPGTIREILSDEMAEARDEVADPDLYSVKTEWDGVEYIGPYDTVLTTLTREQFEERVAGTELIDLPPRFLHGPAVLADLRQRKADNDEWKERVAREEQEAIERDQAADLKREEQNLERAVNDRRERNPT